MADPIVEISQWQCFQDLGVINLAKTSFKLKITFVSLKMELHRVGRCVFIDLRHHTTNNDSQVILVA